MPICGHCKSREHDRCTGKTSCFCQHRMSNEMDGESQVPAYGNGEDVSSGEGERGSV